MSPTTLIVVRAMSRIRSTPMIIAIVSGSTFTAASTPINNGSDPPGTPAAPTAVITLRTMTTICWGNVRETPKTCARKSTVTPSNNDVHERHRVVRGRDRDLPRAGLGGFPYVTPAKRRHAPLRGDGP